MKRLMVLIAAVAMVLVGCSREGQDVTGSYGGGVLAGTVVLSGIEGSPEGVEVSVRDTGMTATLGADGRFAFSGVPDKAILDFRRGDGIQASLAVSGNGKGGSVMVQLGRGSASKSSGRGNSGKDKREFEGLIVSASAEELVLFTSHKEEVTIGLSADTVIRKGNEILTAADLTADMRVHVKAKKVDDTLTALLVIVQEGEDDGEDEERPELREYEGTIVSASATELVVFTSKKVEVTFVLSADTVIRKGNTPVAPEDLRPGQRVHVKGLAAAADGPVTAVQVVLQNTHDSETVTVSGDVTGVSGGNLTVATRDGEWTVQTSATTRIRKQGKAIALADIATGDKVTAKGRRVSENTILASEVEVRGKSGRP
jgi:hypothetical protein